MIYLYCEVVGQVLHFAQFLNVFCGVEYVQSVGLIYHNCKIAELVSLLLLHLALYKYWSFLREIASVYSDRLRAEHRLGLHCAGHGADFSWNSNCPGKIKVPLFVKICPID